MVRWVFNQCDQVRRRLSINVRLKQCSFKNGILPFSGYVHASRLVNSEYRTISFCFVKHNVSVSRAAPFVLHLRKHGSYVRVLSCVGIASSIVVQGIFVQSSLFCCHAVSNYNQCPLSVMYNVRSRGRGVPCEVRVSSGAFNAGASISMRSLLMLAVNVCAAVSRWRMTYIVLLLMSVARCRWQERRTGEVRLELGSHPFGKVRRAILTPLSPRYCTNSSSAIPHSLLLLFVSIHLTLLLKFSSKRSYVLSIVALAMNARSFEGEKSLEEQDIFVSLTYDLLDATAQMARVKSPKAGAVVLFAGTSDPMMIYHHATQSRGIVGGGRWPIRDIG